MKYPFILLLIFAMIICFGCKKKCTEYKLGDLTIYNPLNGTETIMFVDSMGNEYSFVGEGRSILIYSTDYNGECYETEGDNCIHQESDNNYRIKIGLRPTSFHDPAYLSIVLSDYRYSESWHYKSLIKFNLPLDRNNLNDNQVYFDSLLVNYTMQYNVFAGVPNHTTTPTTKETRMDTVLPSMFYYNKQYGLIKVDFDDGSSWELNRIGRN